MTAPIVILVCPQMGENIGAVARAMSNFGFNELRLVSPRDGWPNPKANEMAAGGIDIIKSAKIFAGFNDAIADIEVAYATTARPRDMEKPTTLPGATMQNIISDGHKAALIFGPERTGLENKHIALCDGLVTIPTSPENSSLNLGQSMVVMGYEWFKASNEQQATSNENEEIATKSDWQGLFEQLEGYLDEVNYYRIPEKKPIMWQNLQTIFIRGKWNSQEVRSFRGVLRSIWERQRKNEHIQID